MDPTIHDALLVWVGVAGSFEFEVSRTYIVSCKFLVDVVSTAGWRRGKRTATGSSRAILRHLRPVFGLCTNSVSLGVGNINRFVNGLELPTRQQRLQHLCTTEVEGINDSDAPKILTATLMLNGDGTSSATGTPAPRT